MMHDPAFPLSPRPCDPDGGENPPLPPAHPDATRAAAGVEPLTHRSAGMEAAGRTLAQAANQNAGVEPSPILELPAFGVTGGKPLQMAPDPAVGGGATSPADTIDYIGERRIDYVPVRAMEDVLALRHRQIHEFGHTLAADLAEIDRTGKRHAIAMKAREALRDAIEDMMFNKDPAQIRRRLAKAGALILASIDAEDARGATETVGRN